MLHASKVVTGKDGRNGRFQAGTILYVAAAMTLLTGCGGASSAPTAPASPTSTSTPASPARPAPVVEVATFDVRFSGANAGWYFYQPTIVLRETSGQSGATLKEMMFLLPDGNTQLFTPTFCSPRGSEAIGAGGRWESGIVAPYCLDITSRVAFGGQPLLLMVSFTDDKGVPGQATASTTFQTER